MPLQTTSGPLFHVSHLLIQTAELPTCVYSTVFLSFSPCLFHLFVTMENLSVCHYFLWTIAHATWPCQPRVLLLLQHISPHIFWQARKNHDVRPTASTKDEGIKVTLYLIFINYCSLASERSKCRCRSRSFLSWNWEQLFGFSNSPRHIFVCLICIWRREERGEEEVLCLKPREGFGSWEQRK